MVKAQPTGIGSRSSPELPPTFDLRRSWLRRLAGDPRLCLPTIIRVDSRVESLAVRRSYPKGMDLNNVDEPLQVLGECPHALVTLVGRLFEALQADRFQGRVHRISPPPGRHGRPASDLHDHLERV